MKRAIWILLLIALILVGVMWALGQTEQKPHRWVSEVNGCELKEDFFVCRNQPYRGSNNFSFTIYDCASSPKEAEVIGLDGKSRGKVGIVSHAVNCKLAVLDWCLEHGETRVLHGTRKK